MTRKIIDRLAILLDSIYPDIPFSDMQDVAGIEPPRFFITCYRTNLIPRIEPAGFFYVQNFDLVFDPGAEDVEEKCNEVAFTLLPALQKIPKGDGMNYRSDNLRSEYDRENGVLHIFFDITVTLHEDVKEDIPDIRRINHITTVEVNYD